MTDGVLIAICGLDGSGKSTQAARLAERLAGLRPATVLRPVTPLFREDTVVRSYLNDGVPPLRTNLIPEIALLGAADRLRQYRTQIKPRLDRGEVVIMDRYVLSTYAWAYARGLRDLTWLRTLNRHLPEADLTICLDVPPAAALARIIARGDTPRWEERDEQRLATVRAALTRDCVPPGSTVHVVDGTLPADDVAHRIAALALPLVPAVAREAAPVT
jgi:dTMP kinase